jgi:hypothetical protein
VQRDQRQQARARLDVVALLHLAVSDYAVDRCDDHGMSLILLRQVERRPGALYARFGLARAVSNNERSEQILEATRDSIKARIGLVA